MRKILIVMGRYLPGYKDGGPVRSIKNLTDRLGSEYEFRILCTDRDHGDTESYSVRYPQLQVRQWNVVGNTKVYYVEPGGFDKKTVEALAAEADLLYMCGCFNDYARTVLGLKRRDRIKCPVVIAAMGLFSPGAFHIKYLKKKTYVSVLKALGYFDRVEWSATGEEEAADIRREIGSAASCHLAEDLPRKVSGAFHSISSEAGSLRVVFLSRISRKKNLWMASRVLGRLQGNIVFDIYGNMEDPEYYRECMEELEKLPSNIHWEYKGEAEAEQVIEVFRTYDVFLFPTIAENFGHVILEAMSAGCIPVISDRTPWTVEKMQGNGISLPLDPMGWDKPQLRETLAEETEQFVQALCELRDLNAQELSERAAKCIQFSENYASDEDSYRRILNR